MRIKIIENIVLVSLALIASALIFMQTLKGQFYYNQSVNNRIRVIPIEGPRGKITDRNGIILADNRVAYHVAVIAQDIDDSSALFGFLGKLLKKDGDFLKRQFLRKKRTPFTPVVIEEDIDQKKIFTIEENRFQYPGLVVEKTYERFYPLNKTGAHAVGYVGKIDASEADMLSEYGYNSLSVVGKSGVEKTYDLLLRGESGGRQIEINNRGQEVRLLGYKDPAKGKDIALTVDQKVQNMAEELLDTRPGAVVIMDLNTGDLLSLVSSPSYDPNAFMDRGRQTEILYYIRDSKAHLINRAIAGKYPPGSVFKIPVALAAIELKKISPDVSFDCPGYYMLGNARFGCAHEHGKEDLNQAIAHSCNVYFFHVGQLITAHVIEQYAKAFGLGRVTGVDLPYEAAGQVMGHARPGHPWYTGNTLNLSIGQGDTLSTPIQLTVLAAAVANDGIILRPRIAKSIDAQELPDIDMRRLPVVRLHDSSWRIIQQGMRSVITDSEGTGHLLNDIPGVTIYGKTGTAQAGGNKPNHAWFVGYLRSVKNNLAFCIFLENGGSSANAVEITHQMLLRMQAQGII